MKKYNLINNSLGWLTFVIAAVTYLLTLEPTASFWDCPEFIAQGYKLEVGHPPGNPIFMLAARFFVNFAPDPQHVAIAVNAMSALLSAGTILLLFWTISALVKKLVFRVEDEKMSLAQMIVIFGSALCGSLVYTWSDTFWFSAVEGEVYAFSSFCTALVVWLILKWDARADEPNSDRYIILIAYVIGISIAVHLLNLLCIPALVLIVYYRKFKETNVKGSLIALGVSFIIVALILFGLVPGFIGVAQKFELFCVNTLGMSYNSGVLIYAILTVISLVWAVYELYKNNSLWRIRISFILSTIFSGVLFIGHGWFIPLILVAGLVVYLFVAKKLPIRILSITALSILVIFVGYSSYALILIRSAANPPMDQNNPDNVFSLGSYLNREQYGETPLFYGRTYSSGIQYILSGNQPQPRISSSKTVYDKAVKQKPDAPDKYFGQREDDYVMVPELNMFFPRMYSGAHTAAYQDWVGGSTGKPVFTTPYVDKDGNPLTQYGEWKNKPTFGENLKYFFVYQLNHMYWRYFMWNFAGRQNDIQGNGEVNHGNWISGIPFIDNARLGDQSLLPDDLGKGNKGHNVFYMLPLLLGIIGLLWQSLYSGKKGIEQFWVVFFLFFMTGIAIVLYLNQPPQQPRERDYAFAGSFYAFSIWVGMGVAGIAKMVAKVAKNYSVGAIVGAVIGIFVPLQMVSQTWDDQDRSCRYTCRDFGMNYLASLDDNAIIFTNGDNDTFPLWYAQEVEGYRTDVRVVNLSYLTQGWYVNQMKYPAYESAPLKTVARPVDYMDRNHSFNYILGEPNAEPINAINSIKDVYSPESFDKSYGVNVMRYPNVFIPIDKDVVIKAGVAKEEERDAMEEAIVVDLSKEPEIARKGGVDLSKLTTLDFIATYADDNWSRPIYFAMTVPENYYIGLSPYLRSTGMVYQVSPFLNKDYDVTGQYAVDTDRMYRNVTERFRWGGLDEVKDSKDIYLDETVRRMVTTTRTALLDLATALYNEALEAKQISTDSTFVKDRAQKSLNVLRLMDEKLPVVACPYALQLGYNVAELYDRLGRLLNDKEATKKAADILDKEIERYSQYARYAQGLKRSSNVWFYTSLPAADKYAYQTYLLQLMQLYTSVTGDDKKILDKVNGLGVDLNEIYMLHQRAAEAEQAEAAAASMPADSSIEDLM
ncbi:MAG: DUF2723 domain-containing protein [Muribaculaceae bacterium]|nr:DUF2723 domain-containing protein [Muribaculaceae bacterium]